MLRVLLTLAIAANTQAHGPQVTQASSGKKLVLGGGARGMWRQVAAVERAPSSLAAVSIHLGATAGSATHSPEVTLASSGKKLVLVGGTRGWVWRLRLVQGITASSTTLIGASGTVQVSGAAGQVLHAASLTGGSGTVLVTAPGGTVAVRLPPLTGASGTVEVRGAAGAIGVPTVLLAEGDAQVLLTGDAGGIGMTHGLTGTSGTIDISGDPGGATRTVNGLHGSDPGGSVQVVGGPGRTRGRVPNYVF
ncbi:MAG TPA: hypothetical protein VFA33_07570 [Bryobacteraceae bacterium]|nr:hypothetical protein [Bryobacteraceae bacterium]